MKKFLLFLFLIICIRTQAQSSREYIRQQIKYQGNCRNVAITKTNGDLMLYGLNGCARQGCPKSLNEAIVELNNDRVYIDDVQLTENGRWLILYGDNGFRWNDIPYSLEQQLREYNNNRETILSVSFNDYGNWIIISTEHFSSSDSNVTEWLKDGMNKFGQLWTTCVTDDCLIAVYQEGYQFLGDVPEDLKKALTNSTINVFRLKVAGTAWFFADNDGRYQYNM